ncbi:MAG: tetratricopeptide repeat protein [Chitinophagaceae bacterium]
MGKKQKFTAKGPQVSSQNPIPKTAPVNEINSMPETTVATNSRLPWVLTLVLAVLSVFLFSNTFNHRFVLDDHGIIKNNKITKAPVSWENTKTIFSTPLRKGDFSDLENSLYRPFTKFLFNIQWNVFDANTDSFTAAHHFHKVNVFLFALTVMLLFWVLYHAMNKRWVVPFLATLLFAVHPIHSEVVANVKSADEILSLLGILLALRCIQLYAHQAKMQWLILGILSFAMGCFSKESTVVGVAIFPLFIYFFTKLDIKKNMVFSGALLVTALFFLFARHQALSGYPQAPKTSPLDNYMVLCDPKEQAVLPLDLQAKYKGSSQFASAVSTLGYYIRQFVYPRFLSCDYSFSTLEPVGFNDPGFIFSFLLFLIMFGYAVWKWKEKSPMGFGFFWFFITMSITSNVFMLIGTSFGERLFFVPSVGISLALVYLFDMFLRKNKNESGSFMGGIQQAPLLFGIIFLAASLYSVRTWSRNADWKSDYSLFSGDIENFPNATHLLFYMGNHLSGTERKEVLTDELTQLGYTQQQINDSAAKESARSIEYFNRSMSLYPALPSDGYNQLGKAYFNFSEGIKASGDSVAYYGYLDSAFKYYTKALAEDSTNGIFINNVGTVYYNRGMYKIGLGGARIQEGINQLMVSQPYFFKAHQRDTLESDFMNNIGCIYGTMGNPDSAIYWFEKALSKDSLDLTSIQFLDITWRNKGNVALADYYKNLAATARIKKAEQLRK